MVKKTKGRFLTPKLNIFKNKTIVVIFVFIVAAIGIIAVYTSFAGSGNPVSKQQDVRGRVVYQVNIPFYQNNPRGSQNAFVDITNRLPEIASLGVNTIQLTPVHTSAYLVLDHYDVSWKYTGKTRVNQGTDAERIQLFKNYVDKAHSLNMKVIMDCVYHGTATNSPLLTEHPDWYKRQANGEVVVNEFGIAQFDTSKPVVQAYLIDVSKFWANQVGIDGCRADMAHSVPLNVWINLNNAMRTHNPNWIMVGEAYGKQAEYISPFKGVATNGQYGFDIVYDFRLQGVLRALVNGDPNITAQNIRQAWQARPKYHREGFYNMIDDQNAATRSAALRYGNPGMLGAMAVNLTLDGVPFIFNGQEIGDTTEGGPKLDETRFYKWSTPSQPSNRAKLTQLICLRKQNQSLSQGTTVWNDTTSPNTIAAYTRSSGNEKTLVVINMSPANFSGTIKGDFSGQVYDMVQGRSLTGGTKSGINLSLSPFSYIVANLSNTNNAATIAQTCI